MRSEHNLSPEQLWATSFPGGIEGIDSSVFPTDFFENSIDASQYGFDWDGPIGNHSPDEVVVVDVPEIHFSPQEVLCHILEMNVNPVAESDEYGIDLYVKCKMIVLDFLSNR
ncbi:PREDICTED: uncharacterized protein LOC109592455 [Amphimedon queenslandica]|uniref:Uncharacterized protein n=1 Tax=Amphimedon queenslandica TaxID=400682 RepID=A0A1X7SM07_AMPQE|nr:PREDICTED: uncharacterized protein LOC109592455 [Amphimedon queenslandica]|eukprot:XP_019863445.1 PREDICTED: uncharacterized protein LOC109592455 [Amphimedon queenslandica]